MARHVLQTHPTPDYQQRVWPEINLHGDERYLGWIKQFQIGEHEPLRKYDVWLVDTGQTLLIQFGDYKGENFTYPVYSVESLAALNTERAELIAHAYHTYIVQYRRVIEHGD